MSFAEIERAVIKLPKRQRNRLAKRLAEEWEDYIDLKIALEVLSEGQFDSLENVEKRLYAKRRHRLQTRRKVS